MIPALTETRLISAEVYVLYEYEDKEESQICVEISLFERFRGATG